MSPRHQPALERATPLSFWEPPNGAGEPLVCIATSYTFDAPFFETECLGRFLQMDCHPSESESIGYLIEREQKLASATVAALVDRSHARDKESLRWDVLGVLVPQAIQHSKVSLLACGNHVRVIIGSGNLTEPGYRKNLEVFGTLDFSKEDGGDKQAIRETIEFLGVVLSYAVGNDGPGTPKGRTKNALVAVTRHINRWTGETGGKRAAAPIFGKPGADVLELATAQWPERAGRPSALHVVSPFFDLRTTAGKANPFTRATELLTKTGTRELYFSVRAEQTADGQLRVYAPKQPLLAARQNCVVTVTAVNPKQDDELRPLHSKLLRLENDVCRLLMIGSSNFTSAGLGTTRARANLEANLVYTATHKGPAFKSLPKIWPSLGSDISLDGKKLLWNVEPEECEDGGRLAPLPRCFREALFVPGSLPRLELSLDEDRPSEWSIRDEQSGTLLLASHSAGTSNPHSIPCADGHPKFVLKVTWRTQLGEEVSANWPVNVADARELAPTEELKALTLEQLLEILASTRPLHEAVVRALRRPRLVKKNTTDLDLDPLRRLASADMLLRRAKRVAQALDRLKERLESPALTTAALEWRLSGPLGAEALARAFVHEATLSGEAKFYLAELALALSRVRPECIARGGIKAAAITTRIAACINGLCTQARSLSTSAPVSPVDAYVERAFAEAVRA